MINDNTHFWLHNQKESIKCSSCATGRLDSRIPQTFLYKYIIFWRTYKNYQCSNCGVSKHIAK